MARPIVGKTESEPVDVSLGNTPVNTPSVRKQTFEDDMYDAMKELTKAVTRMSEELKGINAKFEAALRAGKF